MNFYMLLPIVVGFSIVFQGVINRQVSDSIGITTTICVNGIIFLVYCGVFWILAQRQMIPTVAPESPSNFLDVKWWHLIPGLFGFLIVLLVPMSLPFLGASLTFSLIIFTQLFLSTAVDSWASKSLPSLSHLGGVLLMMGGIYLIYFGKK